MESSNPPTGHAWGYAEYTPEQAAFLDVELSQLGLSRIDYRILEDLSWSPKEAAVLISSLYVRGGSRNSTSRLASSEDECWQAIERCIEKGVVQRCDDQSLLRMLDIVRANSPVGPVRFFPRWGEIDYTEIGLTTLERISRGLRDLEPKRPPRSGGRQVSGNMVRQLTAHYFAELRTAQAFLSSLSVMDYGMVSSIRLVETGPWRRQWWEPALGGYKVLVEISNPTDMLFKFWRASRSAVVMERPADADDQADRKLGVNLEGQARAINQHGMSWDEWCVLRRLGAQGFEDIDTTAGLVAQECAIDGSDKLTRKEHFSVIESVIESCIRKGWVWRLTDAVVERIKRHISGPTPVMLLLPIPNADDEKITLSLEGAELFRSIFETVFGKTSTFDMWQHGRDWFPEGLRSEYGELIEQQVYEYYALSEDGFSECEPMGSGLRVYRKSALIPIGPWCVYWWKRFPAGWKVEVEFRRQENEVCPG